MEIINLVEYVDFEFLCELTLTRNTIPEDAFTR